MLLERFKVMRKSARFAKGDKKAFKKWFNSLSKEDQQKWLDSQAQYSISSGSNKPVKKTASAKRVAFKYLVKSASDDGKVTFAIDGHFNGRSFLRVHRLNKDQFERNYGNKDVITNWQAFQFMGSLITLDEIEGYYTEDDVPRLRSLIERYDGGVEHFILVGERPGGNGKVIHRESFGKPMGDGSVEKKKSIGIYIQTRRHGYVSGEPSGMVVKAPINFVTSSSFLSQIADKRRKQERESRSEGATTNLRLLINMFVNRGTIRTNGYLREINDLDYLVVYHLDGFEVFNRKGESMRQKVSY